MLYEPDLEQVRTMLATLRGERPVDGRVVQFSGGEPTIHPQFFEILSMAREMGFTHIQAATNGIELANSNSRAKPKQPGWQRSICSSTASPMTSIVAFAASHCSTSRCRSSRTAARLA